MTFAGLLSGILEQQGGVTPAWDPGDLTGIDIWLRADDLNAAADASQVTTWTDRIIAAAFTQATAAKKPTFYKTTSSHLINGQPCVYFDGVDDLLSGPVLTGSSGHIIVVGQFVSLPLANVEGLVTSSDTAASNFLRFRTIRPVLDTFLTIIQNDNTTADTIEATTTALTVGTDYALELASSGTAYEMRVNGTVQAESVTSGTDSGDWFADTPARDNTVIGATKRSIETDWSDIDVAEVIIVKDANLTAGERTSLNSYISSRYGIIMV